jgi:hypothetical protein
MSDQEHVNQSVYLMFRSTLNHAGYQMEDAFIMDPEKPDPGDFDRPTYFALVTTDRAPGVTVGVTVDVEARQWYLSADSGHYQVGRKWPIVSAEGRPFVEMLLFLDLLTGA